MNVDFSRPYDLSETPEERVNARLNEVEHRLDEVEEWIRRYRRNLNELHEESMGRLAVDYGK